MLSAFSYPSGAVVSTIVYDAPLSSLIVFAVDVDVHDSTVSPVVSVPFTTLRLAPTSSSVPLTAVLLNVTSAVVIGASFTMFIARLCVCGSMATIS